MDEATEQLIRDLLDCVDDRQECRVDHDGACQEHMWWGEGECPVPRAKRYLEERGEQS